MTDDEVRSAKATLRFPKPDSPDPWKVAHDLDDDAFAAEVERA